MTEPLHHSPHKRSGDVPPLFYNAYQARPVGILPGLAVNDEACAREQFMRHFSMPVRVYLEDTDAGGIVYHASYLRFMERARTEWLRAGGIRLDEWQERHRTLFVVRSMTVDYLGPARLDDRLDVTVNMLTMKRASLICEQAVLRGEETLTSATVRLACIDADTRRSGQPAVVAIPPAIREAMHA